MNIGTKLGVGFGVVFILLTSLTFFAINRMQFLADQTVMIYNHPLTVESAVLRIDTNIIKVHRTMKDVVLAPGLEDINKESRIVDAFEREIYDDFEIIGSRFLGDKALYLNARRVFSDWKPIRDEVISLMRSGKSATAVEITKGKGARYVVKIENSMEALSRFSQNKAIEFVRETEQARLETFKVMYLLFFLVIIVGVVFAIYLTMSISRPLLKLFHATQEIGARGSLAHEIDIKSKDEVGELAKAINNLSKNLQESQRKLLNKEKFAAVGQLAGNVGHDLRNPLGVINNSIYYLRNILESDTDTVDKRVLKHLNILDREISRSNNIINDLLDFSMVRPPSFEEADLNHIVLQALKNIEVPENIKVESGFVNEALKLNLDELQIHRALINIITNAIAAMSYGGDLKITTQANDGYASVVIKDNGDGIPKENYDRIFEPLFTTRTKGTGLGLSIVRDIIKNNNGKLEFESEVGKGTTFTIMLPLKTDKEPSDE